MNSITKHPLKSLPTSVDRHIRDYKNKQVVLHKGDKIDSIYWVSSGWIKVYDHDINGNEKILLILTAGDLMPVIWRDRISTNLHYNYETIGEARLTRIDMSQFERQLDTNHDFAKQVLEFSLNITHELLLRAESIEATSNSKRILQTLEYLYIKTSTTKDQLEVDVPFSITHEMIANMSGMTRESVSKELKALGTQGIIEDTSRKKLKIFKEKLYFALS